MNGHQFLCFWSVYGPHWPLLERQPGLMVEDRSLSSRPGQKGVWYRVLDVHTAAGLSLREPQPRTYSFCCDGRFAPGAADGTGAER